MRCQRVFWCCWQVLACVFRTVQDGNTWFRQLCILTTWELLTDKQEVRREEKRAQRDSLLFNDFFHKAGRQMHEAINLLQDLDNPDSQWAWRDEVMARKQLPRDHGSLAHVSMIRISRIQKIISDGTLFYPAMFTWITLFYPQNTRPHFQVTFFYLAGSNAK